jgi:hypothetical protein
MDEIPPDRTSKTTTKSKIINNDFCINPKINFWPNSIDRMENLTYLKTFKD